VRIDHYRDIGGDQTTLDKQQQTMDLCQLFTITDYVATTICIPCHPISTEEDDDAKDEQSSNELSIELFYSPAASTDYDLTGQIIWPVSGKAQLENGCY
jgi:hypothetical protein